MLDTNKCKQILEVGIEVAVDYFGITHDWVIRFDFSNIDSAGLNSYWHQYKESTILINPFNVGSYKDLWKTIGHEVAHIVLAPFSLVENILDQNNVNQVVFNSQLELVTQHLTFMFERDCSYFSYFDEEGNVIEYELDSEEEVHSGSPDIAPEEAGARPTPRGETDGSTHEGESDGSDNRRVVRGRKPLGQSGEGSRLATSTLLRQC